MGEATKTIRVSEELHSRIKAHSREGETLGETLERLVGPPSLRELVGILSDDDAEVFREAINESHRVRPQSEGIVFAPEKDGSITAKDLENDLARGGDTRAEALSQLAEALELHAGGGDPVTDEDLEEWGLDPDEFDDKELPDFLQ